MDDEIYDALKPYANQASRDEFFRGTLGKIDPSTGVVQFADPGKAGNVWVLNPQTNTYVSAFLDGAPPQVSIPVMVRKHPYHGQWIVDSVYHPDMPTYAGAGNPPPVSVPPTPTGPGTGRNQPISASLLLPGMVTPSLIAPLSVSIYQFNYVWNGQKYFFPTTEFDLTPYLPGSANTHGWVLVGVDPTTNTATALAGASYPLATVLTQATVNLVSLTNKLPLFAVAMYNGQTALTNTEGTSGNPGTFADCRPWLAFDNSYVETLGVQAPITNVGTALNPIIGLSTPLDVIYGGTKLATLTAHAVMIGNGTSAPTFLSPGSAGQFMRSNATDWLSANIINSDLPTSGVSAASYTNTSLTVNAQGIVTAASSGTAPVTSIGVTAPITSTGGTTPTIGLSTPLAVQYGGSGSASLAAHAMLIGNGTSAIVTLAPGASAHVAISDGTDWGSRLLIASDFPNTAVTPGSYTNTNLTVDAQGRITAASNGSAGTGTVTSITAGTGLTGGVITTSGTIALSVPVSVANGGTGQTSLTAHNLIVGNGTSAVALLAPGSSQNAVFSNGTDFTSRVIDAGDVQTGTFANARVNWAAPGTLGSTTPNTVAATNITITGGGYIKPSADSTTAILCTKADGTTIIWTVDSTNKRLGLGITPTVTLDVAGIERLISGSNTITFTPSTPSIALVNQGVAGAILTAEIPIGGILAAGLKINTNTAAFGYVAAIGNGFISGPAGLSVLPGGTGTIGLISSNGSSNYIFFGEQGVQAGGALGYLASNQTLYYTPGSTSVSSSSAVFSISRPGVTSILISDTATNANTSALIVSHGLTTINAGANNISVDLTFKVADSTSAISTGVQVARIRSLLPVATHASRTGQSIWSVSDSTGERDVIGIGANGSAATLGVFGVTQVAQQASSVALELVISNFGFRASGTPALGKLGTYNGDTLAGNGLVSVPGLIHLTGQTASIGTTTTGFTPPANGMYEVSVALYDTTAAGASVATVSATISWTDPNGAQTFTTANLPVSALGNTTNVITFYATTGSAISYATTVTGLILTAQYELDVAVMRLS